MGYILVYTREPEAAQYHAALAHSVHFAYSGDGLHYEPFNLNYGVLFAQGEISRHNTIVEKALINPRAQRLPDETYRIQAQQTTAAGEPEPLYPQWTTRDFRTFHYLGTAAEPTAFPQAADTAADIPGGVPGNRLSVDDAVGLAALTHWSPLENTAVHVPAQVTVHSAEDAQAICATAEYSDGSTCEKHVRWDLTKVDFNRPGTCRISGTAEQLEPPFPLTRGHGDPVFFPWNGMWHYIATNDNNDDKGFTVRRAPTVEALFAPDVEQSVIFDVSEQYVQTFWAPEFHVIGGALYLLFAVSGAQWGPQCHMMKLKSGGDILCADDWEAPVRVCRANGKPLTETAITLDMTYLPAGGRSYLVWSYREQIGTPLDSGSMLCIATVDPAQPARLTSEPVLLSRPLYGWENRSGTINNEGPYAFVRNGKVYLTYSGGAANGYSYAVGLLTADAEADLLQPRYWTKRPAPVLSYLSVPGRLGPGHNSFFTLDGQLYIAYHAEFAMENSPRCAALHRVAFDRGDEPRFDLGPLRDLNPALRTVSTLLQIQ